MSALTSGVFTVLDSAITERSMFSTKSLMPLDGDIRIWYGSYSGTYTELKTAGMLIPEGKLLEHVNSYDGVISLVSPTGSVVIHEVK